MDTTGTKYFKILRNLFLMAISFITAVVLVFLGLRYAAALFDRLPIATYIYIVLVLAIMPLLFGIVYLFLIKKSLRHPKVFVRWLSVSIFSLFAASFAVTYVRDMVFLSKAYQADIDKFWTYNVYFLALNMLFVVLVSVMQALTVPDEKFWLDKYEQTDG